MSRSLPRTVTALLLVSALAAPAVLAAAPPARGGAPASAMLAGAVDLFGWLARWATALVHGDNGCGADPDGICRSVAPGRAARSAIAKNGCGLDPNGQPLCGARPSAPVLPTGDAGCGADPNGCHH